MILQSKTLCKNISGLIQTSKYPYKKFVTLKLQEISWLHDSNILHIYSLKINLTEVVGLRSSFLQGKFTAKKEQDATQTGSVEMADDTKRTPAYCR